MKNLVKLGIFSILLGFIIMYKEDIVELYNVILVKFSKQE